MNEQFILDFGLNTIQVVIMLCTPPLAAALIVGVLISIFQAITSIQDMTLTFVPKVLCVGLVTLVLGSWMMRVLIEFSQDIFMNLQKFM